MQIGEKNLAPAQQRELCFERFLDFHNHVSARENFFCLLHNFRARFNVVLVGVAGNRAQCFFPPEAE